MSGKAVIGKAKVSRTIISYLNGHVDRAVIEPLAGQRVEILDRASDHGKPRYEVRLAGDGGARTVWISRGFLDNFELLRDREKPVRRIPLPSRRR